MISSLVMEDTKISDCIEKLLEEKEGLEVAVLSWMSEVLKMGAISSFLELAEQPSFLERFAVITKLHNILPNHEYYQKPEIVQFVDMLAEIWRVQKDIKVFAFFDAYFRKELSPTFTFETDFEGLLFTHSDKVIYAIIIVSVLSICLVNDDNEEDDLVIFECLEHLEPTVQGILKNEFKMILELFDSIGSTEDENHSVVSPYSTERTKRTATQIELNYVRKVEELQKTNEKYSHKVKSYKELIKSLQHDNSVKEKVIEEQNKKINHLTFAREDLLEKLKSKNLEFINAEIQEKDAEIQKLKDNFSHLEKTMTKRIREIEDENENLHKQIHQLENYKVEFETIKSQQQEVFRKNSEEVSRSKKDDGHFLATENAQLKEQIKQLQAAKIADKEKCVNLEVMIANLNKEVTTITLEKLDLENKLMDMPDNGFGNSEIYLQDHQQLIQDLSSQKYVNRLKEVYKSLSAMEMQTDLISVDELHGTGNGYSAQNKGYASPYVIQRSAEIFVEYQKHCVAQVKLVLRELNEYKDQAYNALKDVEALKDSIEELEERAMTNDNEIVVNLLIGDNNLAQIYRQVRDSNLDSSEIAQHLLKVITQKEAEILRIRRSRKRMQREVIAMDASKTECNHLIYTTLLNYFAR
jgi:hypothetical protein